jgi:ABC-type uncharacterized transport system substrate-binding protein
MNKTIGFLVAADPDDWQKYTDAFEDGLRDKGWKILPDTGAKEVSIDYEPKVGALGNPNTYATVANQFVTNAVDVIVTAGELAADACQTATKANKPPKPVVVVASAGDLSKFRGTNVTGFTNGQVNSQILDKRIEIMTNKWNPIFVIVAGNDDVPPVKEAMDYVFGKLANNKRYKISLKNNTDVTNLRAALASQKKPDGVNVLYVCSDPFVRTNGDAIIQAARDEGMKTMHEFAEWHDKHKGDLCFGPDFKKLFKRAAGYVDLILADPKLAMPPIVEAQIGDCVQTP